jgi:hypothetical protein
LDVNVASGHTDNIRTVEIESVVAWRNIVIFGDWVGARVLNHEPLRFVVDQQDSAENTEPDSGILPLEHVEKQMVVSHTKFSKIRANCVKSVI